MNNYPWIDQHCLSKPGAEKDFKEEWNATRYMLRKKMFAMLGGDKTGKSIITLKLNPDDGHALRERYRDIIPGYYMNKEHWNSVYLEGSIPDDVLRGMIDASHGLIIESLPKKKREEILSK